jgi:nucleoside 2-deoxyribosyltransferase
MSGRAGTASRTRAGTESPVASRLDLWFNRLYGDATEHTANGTGAQMRIYLAGPLFTIPEREFNARLAEGLRDRGHTVLLPQEFETPDKTPERIFADDVAAIDDADVVLANMDGPDPDSGTCWECGYAYGRRKPCLVYRTDFRAADKRNRAPFNPMLAASASRPPMDLAFAEMETVIGTVLRELQMIEPLIR